MSKMKLYLLIVLTLLCVTGCFEKWNENELKIAVKWPDKKAMTKRFIPNNAVKILVSLDNGVSQIIQRDSNTTQQTANTKFENLKIGTYNISAIAYDKDNKKLAAGEATVEVKTGDNSVVIDLKEIISTLTSLSVENVPTKTEYMVGDSNIDISGLVITENYSDGTTRSAIVKIGRSSGVTISALGMKEITVTSGAIAGFSTTSAGSKLITVTIGDNTTSFEINVFSQNIVTSIAITVFPSKRVYELGASSLDVTGLTVVKVYSDGTTEELTGNQLIIDGFDSTSIGSKTITIIFENKTTSFNIEVVNSSTTTSSPIKMISAGTGHSMILKNDGTLLGTGSNAYGQLGDGNNNTTTSTPIIAMSDVAFVAAGSDDTMILKKDGKLFSSGYNFGVGQLGNGTTNAGITPVEIMSNVKTVSAPAGGYFTMIIKNDKTLWATGSNESGQLGDGTTLDRNTPVKIMENVASVSAGWGHTMILKKDGTLWTTGFNSNSNTNEHGQLGIGTSIGNISLPVQIMDNVSAVSAGNAHTMIIKNDGTLWATGSNSFGQLGDGTTILKTLPKKIAENVASVSAGYNNTIFVKKDGTIWGMGENGSGQLGNGTTTTTYGFSPVQMILN